MMDKIKQLRKLKKQMDSIEVEEVFNGVTVKMDGNLKIIDLKIENKDDKKLEKNIRKAVNRAAKSIQKKMAQDMMGQGGGLGNLF